MSQTPGFVALLRQNTPKKTDFLSRELLYSEVEDLATKKKKKNIEQVTASKAWMAFVSVALTKHFTLKCIVPTATSQ